MGPSSIWAMAKCNNCDTKTISWTPDSPCCNYVYNNPHSKYYYNIYYSKAYKTNSRPNQAADKLGKGQNVKSLNESGSDDIKEALIAFNIMNKRLMKLISNQKQMLGAISHDLRSPLTSLRLRLETLNDSKNKEKMIHTVEEMNRMISSILTFIKQQADENTGEKSEIVNLYSFISSLSDEYIDTGRNLQLDYKLNKNLYFNCRYNSLRRALRNLIDNGLNYGTKVIVKVEINTHKNIIFYIMDNELEVPEEF